ncbi:MAG: recombination mediator RecR [bacterium]|nr:recombination mediator RecR [bacterium]
MASSKAIPEPISRLIEAFSGLPGVGPKSAARLTYYLLRAPDQVALGLADALRALKDETILCSNCFNIATADPCSICADSSRDQRTIAVVEEPLDVIAVERTGEYRGVYHVLHGAISPVNGIGPDDLKIRELVGRVDRGGVLEVIMATNPGMEGDATANYIRGELAGKGAKITTLARGLPIGGDIEYADSVTLSRALRGRSEI